MMDANLLSWDEASSVTGTSKRSGTSTFEDGAEKASPASSTKQLKDDLYDTGDNEDSLS
jgi:hypothetical protein